MDMTQKLDLTEYSSTFQYNFPSMTLKFHKMAIMMPVLMIFAIFDGCLGVDPQDIEWTPELKRKLSEIFHKISPNVRNHPQQLLNVWNSENPSHRVSDGKALHELALSLTDDSKRKGKNIVKCSQVEWTREMQVLLSYIRNKLRNEGDIMPKKIAAKWKLFYPRSNIYPTTLEKYSRLLEDRITLNPTEEELREAEEKYNKVIAENEKRRGKLKEGKHEKDFMKPQIRWTPELKTDLWYIAKQLEAVKIPLASNLKMCWNRMNKEYTMVTEEALLIRLKRIGFENFVPIAVDMINAKARFDRLFPNGIQNPKSMRMSRQKHKIPTEPSQPTPHEWHYPVHPVPTFEHLRPSSSHLVDHTYHQSMGGNYTAGTTSSYYLGDHGPGDKITSSSQFHQYELHQQHLDDPIYSPFHHDDLSYTPAYDVHPFTPSFNPYMYNSSHHPGESSSSKPPGDSQGQHPPQP